MATVQSEVGKIRIFEDFISTEMAVATNDDVYQVGQFRVVGDTLADADAGVLINESDPNLNGVARLTSPHASDNDSLGITTSKMFDVAKMGPLVAEIRVQFDDLDTKEFFFGFTDENDDDQGLEGDMIHGGTATLTLTASDLCGFFWSAELTEDEMWHCVYNGGTTTGETVSADVESGIDLVAAEYNILRIEIDPNGTARWYIDGVLKQTVAGAVSTTTDLACGAFIEVKGTNAAETADIDYILIEANRDWTV